MSVDTHSAGGDVGSDVEVRQPQVFNVSVAEGAHDRLVEVGTFEHRRRRVSQVPRLSPPSGHFLQVLTTFLLFCV